MNPSRLRVIHCLFAFCLVHVGSGTGCKPKIKVAEVSQVVTFGRFCGECPHHCANMYQFSSIDSILLVDTTDSFFANRFPKSFNLTLTSEFALAKCFELVELVPESLFSITSNSTTFGCPDCTDGCGLYFAIRRGELERRFYIDKDSDELPNDIRRFSEELENAAILLESSLRPV